jgi:Xaa-Pro aminopeptidase
MRIQKLRETMQRAGADAALITSAVNVRYYSGFSGVSSQLLITPDKKLFFTDFRYTEQAEAETDFTVIETNGNERVKVIFEYAAKEHVKRLGIDLSEVSFYSYKSYLEHIDEAGMIDLSSAISSQRCIKDAGELELITKGAKYNDELFSHLCTFLKPGISEMDIKAEIVYYMNKRGAETAFDPIVASGPNSSLPHATPTDRKIEAGDFVTMDYGCRFGGYCSDFTRTVAISHIDKEMEKVYDIVDCASGKAFEALKPGARTKDVDAAARNHIAEAGYGESFGHGLGHGVGMFIHETPTLNALSGEILEPGMVLTIEPGIYLKGRYGVRIEDLCVVTKGGFKNLTAAPREMIII